MLLEVEGVSSGEMELVHVALEEAAVSPVVTAATEEAAVLAVDMAASEEAEVSVLATVA